MSARAGRIEAHQISKSYGNGRRAVTVLREVDLAIRGGDFVAIAGSSGCGKTTLLNCLSGLDEPDKGRVVVEDHDLSRLSDRARTRHRAQRMGFVFQSFNLIPVLSAVQNVEMPLRVLGIGRREARRRALGVLEEVGLADRATHRPAELSGGQQQRVAIARALVNQPAVVWADEPTGNLDSETGGTVLEVLYALNRDHGVTLVVVTHDPRVSGRARRMVRMDSGIVVEDSDPERFIPLAPNARNGHTRPTQVAQVRLKAPPRRE